MKQIKKSQTHPTKAVESETIGILCSREVLRVMYAACVTNSNAHVPSYIPCPAALHTLHCFHPPLPPRCERSRAKGQRKGARNGRGGQSSHPEARGTTREGNLIDYKLSTVATQLVINCIENVIFYLTVPDCASRERERQRMDRFILFMAHSKTSLFSCPLPTPSHSARPLGRKGKCQRSIINVSPRRKRALFVCVFLGEKT